MLKEDVLDYIMNTPYNTNWAVLKTIVGDNEELYKYITETPYNTNRAVVSGILDRIDTNNGIVIFDDTVDFIYIEQANLYNAEIQTSFTYFDYSELPPFIILIIDNKKIKLPYYEGTPENPSSFYGEINDNGFPILNTYPIAVKIATDGIINIVGTIEGTKNITIIVPDGYGHKEEEEEEEKSGEYILFDSSVNATLTDAYITNNMFRCTFSNVEIPYDIRKTILDKNLLSVIIKIMLKNVDKPIDASFFIDNKGIQQQSYMLGDVEDQLLIVPTTNTGNASFIVILTSELEEITSKNDIDKIQVFITENSVK